MPWPPQGIYAKKPLKPAADLKGPAPTAPPPRAKIAELVGAQPVTVQAVEVSQALATGVVDSYVRRARQYDTKTYEHQIAGTDTQATSCPRNRIVNQKAFDALDPAAQAAVGAVRGRGRGARLEAEPENERGTRPRRRERHEDRVAVAGLKLQAT